MPGQVGMTELLVVLVIALVVLGPQRLPVVARNIGRGIREFKEAINLDPRDDDEDRDRELERQRERDADEARKASKA
jgi:TatA/E family protein of Tat protein translocase